MHGRPATHRMCAAAASKWEIPGVLRGEASVTYVALDKRDHTRFALPAALALAIFLATWPCFLAQSATIWRCYGMEI